MVIVVYVANPSPVKVRLQTQNHAAGSRNMLGMFVHVYKDNGIGGLYSGVCHAHQLHWSSFKR